VRDFSGGSAGFLIEWDVRPVYDFVFSLSDKDDLTHDVTQEDIDLVAAGRARLLAEAEPEAVAIFDGDCGTHIASFAVGRPELQTAAQFVDAVEQASLPELYRAIVSDVARDPSSMILVDRAIAGDSAPLEELKAASTHDWKAGPLRLLEEPAKSQNWIVQVLRIWLELYQPHEDRIAAILARDYALKAEDRTSLAPVDLIERATGGIRWLPEPGVRRAILAPSYFTRPYNFLLAGDTWRFFGYPVADDALEVDDPLAAPPNVVRLHRALGDGTRLRILKLLSANDLYLTEIAQQLELSKPTIKHHLALLRAAGLVTITEAGTVIYYSLRRSGLDEATTDLKRFLLG
jgi:DNA-binding transcriptional ArsR family regulator